jgi:hypothetical protein
MVSSKCSISDGAFITSRNGTGAFSADDQGNLLTPPIVLGIFLTAHSDRSTKQSLIGVKDGKLSSKSDED